MKRAIVVGAGIAGLCAARALGQQGWEVEVLERQPSKAQGGAGIILGANAVACLEKLGLAAGLMAQGRRLKAMTVRTNDGRVLHDVSRDRLGISVGVYALTRPALHDVLLERLPEGITVSWGRACSRVEPQDGGRVRVEAGGVWREVDLLVGADGIHSPIRQALTAMPERLRYAGQTCWRMVVPNVVKQEDPVEIWGPSLRVGLVPLAAGALYVYLVARAAPGSPSQCRQPDVERAALAARFAPFGELVPEVLAVTPPGALLHHELYDLPTPGYGQGSVVLIGDAAHAMTPNLGQGAAMGIEDAILLARVAHTPDPAKAFAAARAARVAHIHGTSWKVGQIAHWENPLACWVRNLAMAWTPDWAAEAQLKRVLCDGPVAVG